MSTSQGAANKSFFDKLPDDLLRQVLQNLLGAEAIARAGLVSKAWRKIVLEINAASRFRRLAERLASEGPESRVARRVAALVEGEWQCNTLEGVVRWIDTTFSPSWSVPAASIPLFGAALSPVPKQSPAGAQRELPSAAGRALASWALDKASAGRPGECAAFSFSCGRPADALRLLNAIERFAKPTVAPKPGREDPAFGRLAALEFGSALLCVFLSDRWCYEYSQQAYALLEAIRSLDLWLGPGDAGPAADGLTAEQRLVVETDVPPGQIMKVIAFAGTGKTRVLVEYVRARPGVRFLYTCFNLSTRDEMNRRLGELGIRNVDVHNYHQLAYGSEGIKFKAHASKFNGGSLTATEVKAVLTADGFIHDQMETAEQWAAARHVKEALVTFMSSADRAVSRAHLSAEAAAASSPDAIVGAARRYWSRMSDPNDLEVRATHDTYFKTWQLSGRDGAAPVMVDKAGRPYDCVLLDEAQDSNPCFIHVFLGQRAARIAVGDPHQQLYGFRLSVDALSAVQAWRTLHLTRSFRFGPAVASLASLILRRFKREIHPVLGRPAGAPDEVVAPKKNEDLAKTKWRPVDGRYAFLARSNAKLFKEAARLAIHNPDIRLCFLGGGGPRGLMQDVMDVFLISKGRVWDVRKGPGKRFKRFDTMAQLKRYAEDAQEVEMLRAIQVVEELGDRIPEMVEKVEAAMQGDESSADVILCTVHQAKGREFDVAVLANDFPSCFEARMTQEEAAAAEGRARLLTPRELGQDATTREEMNVLYVAATRARRLLVVPWSLYNLATRPLALGPRLGVGPSAPCKLCWRQPQPQAVPQPAGRPVLALAACGHDPLVASDRAPVRGGDPVGAGGLCGCPRAFAPELARCLNAYATGPADAAPPPLAAPAPPTPSRARVLFQAAVAASSPQSPAAGPSAGPSSAGGRRRAEEGEEDHGGPRRRLSL